MVHHIITADWKNRKRKAKIIKTEVKTRFSLTFSLYMSFNCPLDHLLALYASVICIVWNIKVIFGVNMEQTKYFCWQRVRCWINDATTPTVSWSVTGTLALLLARAHFCATYVHTKLGMAGWGAFRHQLKNRLVRHVTLQMQSLG